jgi:hypothetical protein
MLSEDVGNFRALEACVDPCLDKPCRPLLIKLAHGPIHSVYLFAEDGLKRISQRVMMGLVHGKDSMPQYAGTKQKVADIILEADNGKPIERSVRSFLRFDESGQVHRDLVVSGFAALDTGLALEAALRKRSGKDGSAKIAGRYRKRISILSAMTSGAERP